MKEWWNNNKLTSIIHIIECWNPEMHLLLSQVYLIFTVVLLHPLLMKLASVLHSYNNNCKTIMIIIWPFVGVYNYVSTSNNCVFGSSHLSCTTFKYSAVVLILRLFPIRRRFFSVLIALTTQFHTIAQIHSCQIQLLLSKLKQQSHSSRTLQSRGPSGDGY